MTAATLSFSTADLALRLDNCSPDYVMGYVSATTAARVTVRALLDHAREVLTR